MAIRNVTASIKNGLPNRPCKRFEEERERERMAKWINCAPQSEWVSGSGRRKGKIVNNRKRELMVFAECRIWRKGPD